MSIIDKHRESVPDNLRAIYAPVSREMEAVEGLLQKEFSSEDSFIDRLAQHGFRLGGKRLRPALVLLSAQACGGICPEHFSMAVTTELIHTATLIHDDVLDDATMRRHLDTVNALWDNEASILLGDYFLARVSAWSARWETPRRDKPSAGRPENVRRRTAADRKPRKL